MNDFSSCCFSQYDLFKNMNVSLVHDESLSKRMEKGITGRLIDLIKTGKNGSKEKFGSVDI